MWWLISKGDDIKKGTSRILDCFQVYTPQTDTVLASTLYQCVLAEPPEYVSDTGVEIVGSIRSHLGGNFDFGENIEQQYNAQLGRQVQAISLQQQILFGNKGDNLTFSCLIGGKEICKSDMSFDR